MDSSTSFIEQNNSNLTVSDQYTDVTDVSAESVTLAEVIKPQVILAIDCKGTKVGCAVYRKDSKWMSCYVDCTIQACDPVEEFSVIFKQWKETIIPTNLLVSPSFPLEFEPVINDKNDVTEYKIDYRPSHEFSVSAAIKNLSNAFTQNASVFQPDYEQAVAHSKFWVHQMNPESSDIDLNPFSNSFFDEDNKLSAGCMSSIFSFLAFEGDMDVEKCIKRFTIDSLENNMVISTETITALRLFQDASHPNLHYTKPTQITSSTCLFKIINQTCSQLGAELLKEWIFKPSTNMNVIKTRHDLIEIFLLSEHDDILKSMRKSLRKIKNVPRIIRDMELISLPLSDWNALVSFLTEYRELLELASRTPQIYETPLFLSIAKALSRELLQDLLNQITSVINMEKSELMGEIEIQPEINTKLDELKENYANLDTILESITQELEEKLQLFGIFSVSYIAQIGFLISVDGKHMTKVRNMISAENVDNWEEVFSTSTTYYYKSQTMQYMNQTLGDIYGVIADMTVEITQKLQSVISEQSTNLSKACRVIAQLDCHLSLAWAARQNGYKRPVMTSGRDLIIKEGYHPLYAKLVETFISNGVSLRYDEEGGDSRSNLLLVTGANFSGKTVYLTQTAVIVVMAQIGSFVPASEARIGIVDRILTRVSSRESVSKSKSSFLSDLEQMSSIFRVMTPRSLLIVDEFGKGTDTKDGAALFGSMINYMQSLENKAPKLIASTHFHELLEQDIIREEGGLNVCYMEIFIDENAGNRGISYLYKTHPGKTSSSFGICCAKMCGIDPDIISLAEKIYEEKVRGGNFATFFLNCSPEEELRLKQAGRIVRKFLEEDLDKTKSMWEFLSTLLAPIKGLP